ncbi:MAG: protein translocase subunit SecDF [Bacteroidales bacterium]
MQNKGFVRVFAVLLTLVCIFYLSFTIVANKYMTEAEESAGGDRVKLSYILDSLSTEKVYGPYTFKEVREMEINLGLDLKGGMNVILELNVGDVLKSLSGNNKDENFNKALVAANARSSKGEKDFIKLFAEEYNKVSPNGNLASIFGTFELKDKINANSTNEQVLSVLRGELESAISNSFNVLRTRIDRFGVVSPNIQRMEQAGRISVELPGIKEPERVRKLLQGSANLEFWETYENQEIFPALDAANRTLAQANASTDTTTIAVVEDSVATEATSAKDSVLNKLAAKTGEQAKATADEAAFKKANPLFSKLQPALMQNGAAAPCPVVGYAHYKDTTEINQILNSKMVRDLLPRGTVLNWTVKAFDEKNQYYQLVALKASNRNGEPALSGDVITDANADFSQQGGGQEVSMAMNQEGAKQWARITRENKGKSIAIVLDKYVYSFPRVNDEIPNGRSSITGNFTPEEAKDLANVLKSGKMPASVKIIQEEVVGPSLGKEAINAGAISFVIALILLMVYMMAIYGVVPGIIANLGLVFNMFFTMGILASFQAVLTLSGIAGLVLSLGVAVDANVLIYERSKEELRNGKNLKKAVEDGYNNAFSAIFDANLTSIITAIILFMFGTGPIKGFATTLIIGLVVSFFTSVFLTRLVYERGLAKGWFKNLTFTTALSKNMLVNPKIDWVGLRKKGYIISAVVLGGFLVSFFVRGLNYGIDFTGGRNYIVRFENPVNPQDVVKDLTPEFPGASVNVITIGDDNQVRITTNYKIEDESPLVDDEITSKLYNGLKPLLTENTTLEHFNDNYILSIQKVGPAIAKDITTGAIWAVIFSMIGMGLYILIRFRDWSFSLGTIASAFHDTLVIIGVYSLFHGFLPFSMEIDQSFIAAVLTVIGYSVNDTVVIFDRIREIIGLHPKTDRKTLINDALNTTLARTISTSLSTFVVLLCMFLLGGDIIRSFCFALIIGIITGTYSTLFIAVPVAYEVQARKEKKENA